jgi:ATP-dependent exoDNAse (exonuclease V) beta subunit
LTAAVAGSPGIRRITVTEWLADRQGHFAGSLTSRQEDALVGVLVHRLFRRETLQREYRPSIAVTRGQPSLFDVEPAAAAAASQEPAVRDILERLVTAVERGRVPQIGDVLDRAAQVWTRLRARPDVADLLIQADEAHAEVPFSMRLEAPGGPVVLRGTIDCLVRTGEALTVLEFKTGRPQPLHEEQLAIYVQAARQLFPRLTVQGRLIYA